MRVYIAGRIADEPAYRTKFAQACSEVLLMGHDPVSPCEIHDGCKHTEWEQWMVCDLHAMLDCDGVYALRDWLWSKGATVEVQLAMRLGKTIIYQTQRNAFHQSNDSSVY